MIFFCLISTPCLAQQADTSKTEVERLHRLGIEASSQRGGWLAALSYFGDALRLSREINFAEGEADVLRSIADLESQAPYRNDEALEYLLMELKVREKIGDRLEIARTYQYIGDFFQNRFHMHEEALAYFQQSITILKSHHHKSEVQAEIWQKIADAYAFVEDMPRYFASCDSLLSFYKSIGAFDKASQLSLKISQEQASLKNLDQSLKYAEQGKRYYSLIDVERIQEKNQELREFDKLLNSLKSKKKSQEEKQKSYYSTILLLILIPSLIASWFIWSYFNKRAKNVI
ncbi:MAG: hypothetical protein NW226_07410 [Microscillaceae bacterium]|nr:hypothetical protein [Microscillaceae bacterium]